MVYLGLLASTLCMFATLLTGLHCRPNELLPLEDIQHAPRGWRRGSAPRPDLLLRLRIATKQTKAFEFEQHVLAISDPEHPEYGQQMKRDEVKAKLRPSQEASERILSWLRYEGVPQSHIEDDGDWITFHMPRIRVERMLNTTFHIYHNKGTRLQQIRTLRYSVPRELHGIIHMIQPTTYFGQTRPEKSHIHHVVQHAPVNHLKQYEWFERPKIDLSCNSTITPGCLRNMYHIDNFRGRASNETRLGIAGFLEQYARYSDYYGFITEHAPYAADSNFTYELVNNGGNSQDNSSKSFEGNLDTQYALSLAYPNPGIYYSSGERGPLILEPEQPAPEFNQNEPFLDFLHYIMDLPDDRLPNVITTSYGENEQSVPQSYANMTCSLYAQLGARGVSMLFSSGDTGAGYYCARNDEKYTPRFEATWPASCPFVTAVGGTYAMNPERAVSFSGGGFSEFFPRLAYQDEAVPRYIESMDPYWDDFYNREGRGIPDVSAQARNYVIMDKGKLSTISGTSCSSPTFAAVISLLNSDRLSRGQKPLGFLNPFLYKYGAKALNDITVGRSVGCVGRAELEGAPFVNTTGAGYAAAGGWDPVTGMGTPNFSRLLEISRRN